MSNKIRIINGDMTKILPTLPATSVAACVVDPPYDLVSITKRFGKEGSKPASSGTEGSKGVFGRSSGGFMGKQWDATGIAFKKETWEAVERVLYPGGFLLAFGGTRTAHRMAVAIEDAGFTINNFIGWVYGSGFPKAQDITKQIDKMEGAERKEKIVREDYVKRSNKKNRDKSQCIDGEKGVYSLPSSDSAKTWTGWKTPQLKPAIEPIYVAQKQLDTADSDLMPLDPFIYNQKCSTKERTLGGKVKNNHPCLKPKKLLSYLMRLVAPSNSTILDPFMGSGSGALGAIDENMSYIGIEMDSSYFEIAECRIDGYFEQIGKKATKVTGSDFVEWQYE